MDNGLNGQNINQAGQGQMVPYAGPVAGGVGTDSLFQIFWRSWWIILILSGLGLGGAFFYLKKLAPKPMYTSTSLLLVGKPSEAEGPKIPGVPVERENFHQTQASVIMSRRIIARALSDPNLLSLSRVSDPNYVSDLLETLSARVAKGTYIISVSASSPYAEDAAKFVNALVHAYRQWNVDVYQGDAAGMLRELNAQLKECQDELNLKRDRLRQLEERRDTAAGGSVGTVAERLEAMKQERNEARIRAEKYRLYYEGLERYETEPVKFRLYAIANQTLIGLVVDDRDLVGLEEELRVTEAELDAIEAGAVAKRSRITQLQSRKLELEEEIQEYYKELVSSHLSLAKSSMEDMVAEAARSAKAYNENKEKLQVTSEEEGTYEDLVDECKMLEAVRRNQVQMITEFQIQMPEGLRIHVLEEAVPASEPDSEQLARVLGIGLALGVMLGGSLAFVRDWRDQRVRSADEITAILGVPVLGAIPTISRRMALSRGQRAKFSSNSRESEACRALRTALFFGVPKHEAATLLITSPGAREGKTTLASNLGIAMANAGQKTLIVDADLRKPMQQRVFAMKDTGKGFTDLLAGTAELSEAIRPSKVRGLDVLPSGPNVGNPSEMLNGPAFPAVLQRLRGMYDRIIIDSPPVGLVTDGQILAAMCDLTLVVLRAGQSTRQVTQRARDALYTVGARIAGAVVNDVSKRDHQYSHYSGYGYYYGGHSEGHKSTSKKLPADVTPASEDGASVSGKKRWDNMFPQS